MLSVSGSGTLETLHLDHDHSCSQKHNTFTMQSIPDHQAMQSTMHVLVNFKDNIGLAKAKKGIKG